MSYSLTHIRGDARCEGIVGNGKANQCERAARYLFRGAALCALHVSDALRAFFRR